MSTDNGWVKMTHPKVDDEIEVLELAVPQYKESGWQLSGDTGAATKSSGDQPSVTPTTNTAQRVGGSVSSEAKEGK